MVDGTQFVPGLDYGNGWTSTIWSILTSVTGLSVSSTSLSGSQTGSSDGTIWSWKILPVLLVGSLVEIGRRLCLWTLQRFKFQYYITAEFHEGDPTYDWIILLLTHEKIWKRTKNFRVTSKTSRRKWNVRVSKPVEEEIADYVPTFGHPQLWRWNGYWIEVTRSMAPFLDSSYLAYGAGGYHNGDSIYLKIYSLDISVLSKLVEAAQAKYLEVSQPCVVVHTLDPKDTYNVEIAWKNVKHKARRPPESIILEEGVFDGIVADAKEFIEMEEWYADTGIPHRRGYLLHGPPGTGKSSTIYGLAGELNMEIFSLSLAAQFVDDNLLERAATSIPKNSIFLIEDIDCAFPSREDPDVFSPSPVSRRSTVTLSGLLNVLDGIGSEEGKLFFATTNYIDHLDPALLRPGRIDKKIQYKLANRMQAETLFRRFFPLKHRNLWHKHADSDKSTCDEKQHPTRASEDGYIADLARSFADKVPEYEFSTAELQGYLLEHKKDPLSAVDEVLDWVNDERAQRAEKKKREEERETKAKANRLMQFGYPFAPHSPKRDPVEIDVAPPSPLASASPVTGTSKDSSPTVEREESHGNPEQAAAIPPATSGGVPAVESDGEKS